MKANDPNVQLRNFKKGHQNKELKKENIKDEGRK